MVWLLVLIGIAVIVYFVNRKPATQEDPVETTRTKLSILPEQFVVLDLETTGLDPFKHEIIEIAAIRINRDSTQHHTLQAFVKPSKKVPKKITGLTGITQEMVDAEGEELASVMKQFAEFFGDCRLVTFNAEFDMAFLQQAASRTGISLPNPVSCALQMSRSAWPNRKSYRLADLARDGGLSKDGTHRALDDAQRAAIVYTSAVAKLGEIR